MKNYSRNQFVLLILAFPHPFRFLDQLQAQEQVLELLPMVSEVNAMSEELDKQKYVVQATYLFYLQLSLGILNFQRE